MNNEKNTICAKCKKTTLFDKRLGPHLCSDCKTEVVKNVWDKKYNNEVFAKKS